MFEGVEPREVVSGVDDVADGEVPLSCLDPVGGPVLEFAELEPLATE